MEFFRRQGIMHASSDEDDVLSMGILGNDKERLLDTEGNPASGFTDGTSTASSRPSFRRRRLRLPCVRCNAQSALAVLLIVSVITWIGVYHSNQRAITQSRPQYSDLDYSGPNSGPISFGDRLKTSPESDSEAKIDTDPSYLIAASGYNDEDAVTYQPISSIHPNYPSTLGQTITESDRPATTSHSASSATVQASTTASDGATTTTHALVADFSGLSLRILPMGDSITFGYGSRDGNGYRSRLYDALTPHNTVQMVGGVEAGNMEQPWCDGFFGKEISYIAEQSERSFEWRPNVVLLHAGTNDCHNLAGEELESAPHRLGLLVDQIHSSCADAAILVAQIIPASNQTFDHNIQVYNVAVAEVVAQRARDGMHVHLVDHYTPVNNDFQSSTDYTRDYLDGIHPNHRGYELMADSWLQGLSDVVDQGWISDPVPVQNADISANGRRKFCANKPHWIYQGEVFNGGHLGPSLRAGPTCHPHSTNPTLCECYYEDGVKQDIFHHSETCDTTGYNYVKSIKFADMTGNGMADLIHLHDDGAFSIFQNTDDGFEFLDFGVTPERSRAEWTHFGDLDGDGISDVLVVRPHGAVEAWLTTYNDGKVSFRRLGKIFDSMQYPATGIRFWDVDGDHRVDLCYIDPFGRITTMLNNGTSSAGVTWDIERPIVTSTYGPRDATFFADISGDGWVDHIIMNRQLGNVDYRKRFMDVGRWTRPERLFNGTGHVSDGQNVLFTDLTGNGRADLLHIDPYTSAISVWKNGCAYQKGMTITYEEEMEEDQ